MPHLIHARIKEFLSGGGGGGGGVVQARRPENSLDVFFLFISQLILQFTEGVQWFYYRENYTFQRIQRGSNIFKGVQLFPGGVQMLISIETHITYDFPGGGGSGPISPLWIRTCKYFINIWAQTVRRLLDFPFLAQDFQIEEGGSQDFLIQSVSGSTVKAFQKIVAG